MMGLVTGARFRAAIGLIAAYAIAIQTLFAALAPIPVKAQGLDHSAWSIICFGSGSAATTDGGNPDTPGPASGKFHCVLCGTFAAAAAILPEAAGERAPSRAMSSLVFAFEPDVTPARHSVGAGSARAPPLTA
jgi:hypothetical protein